MLRCTDCGEKLTRVETRWDGWETQRYVTSHGHTYLDEYEGEAKVDTTEVDRQDYDQAEITDSDYEASVEAYICPECGAEEGSLADLVETYDDEEEEAEHGPYELVGAAAEAHFGWFDTLTEAIDCAEGERSDTVTFVRHEGKAVWVNEANGSDQGYNYKQQPKGGELAEDGQDRYEVVGGGSGRVFCTFPSLDEAIRSVTGSPSAATALRYVRMQGTTRPLWATEACKQNHANAYKAALKRSGEAVRAQLRHESEVGEVEADDDDLSWVAGLE